MSPEGFGESKDEGVRRVACLPCWSALSETEVDGSRAPSPSCAARKAKAGTGEMVSV